MKRKATSGEGVGREIAFRPAERGGVDGIKKDLIKYQILFRCYMQLFFCFKSIPGRIAFLYNRMILNNRKILHLIDHFRLPNKRRHSCFRLL